MMMILRHLISILILPFTMVILVPRWLLREVPATDAIWASGSAGEWIARVAGAVVFVAGFSLFAWCVSLFAREGKGTLAPWDPTKRMVAVGPYRYVRNPMISGVLAMITGEALFHGSLRLAGWVATFFMINCIYFIALEEPGLERRFGDDYRRYKAAVPRWIPRLKPWKGD